MSSNSTINVTFMKAAVAMASAVALDLTFAKDRNLTTSLMIGAAAGAGTLSGNYLAQLIPALIPDDTSENKLYTGQALMERGFEVSGSVGAIILLEKYYRNLNRQDSVVEILGVSCAAVAMSEVVTDYISSRPISIFA